MAFQFDFKGLAELKAAVARNPQKTLDEISKFLTRGGALYRRSITGSPWRVGMTGGGIPIGKGKGKGNLKSDVVWQQKPTEWRAWAQNKAAKYAGYVHDGTSKMKARPWFDYAKDQNRDEIDKLSQEMLNNIVTDLIK